jgi:hypothetical protein
MKKILGSIMFVASFYSCSFHKENEYELKEYINDSTKIKIDIPETYVLKQDKSEGYIWYNPSDTSSGFVEHFNLLELIKPTKFQNIDFFEYYTKNFDDIVEDYKVIKYENLQIRNTNVRVLLFSGKINNQKVSAYFILFSENEKLFSLSMYTTHSEQLKLFEKVYKTLVLL